MAKLVALALDGGPTFVEAIQRVWEQGDAAFPLDLRLPAKEQARVMAAMAPGAVIESDGERSALAGGVPVRSGDALVIATSGTTGEAKGVIHTHDGVMASAKATSEALGVNPDRDRWLACLPLAHIGGLSVVTRALLTNTPLEVHSRFDPQRAMTAAQNGATLTSLVTKTLASVNPESFRTILIGGAAPPSDRPVNVIATYGMTETGSGIVYERQPLDGVEIRIDEEQEIWLRGPMLLRAYRTVDQRGPDDSDPKSPAGWFGTGDLGQFAPGGELQVFGRRGDVIVTGAEKVWPARVEPLLNRQPGVIEAMIVGRPHPEWGQEVVALIVPRESDGPSLVQIREAVKAELPVWYAPRSIELVGALPKTSLGKIVRGGR